MTAEEFEQLKTALIETVKSTVNGKIDAISSKLDSYIKEDNAWKETAEPVIQMGNTARGASRAMLWLATIILAIVGVWQMIKSLLKK